jgi:hypothetical protein
MRGFEEYRGYRTRIAYDADSKQFHAAKVAENLPLTQQPCQEQQADRALAETLRHGEKS